MRQYVVEVRFGEEPVFNCVWETREGNATLGIADTKDPDALWRVRQLLREAEFRLLKHECGELLKKMWEEFHVRDRRYFGFFGLMVGGQVYVEEEGDLKLFDGSTVTQADMPILAEWAARAQGWQPEAGLEGFSLISLVR